MSGPVYVHVSVTHIQWYMYFSHIISYLTVAKTVFRDLTHRGTSAAWESIMNTKIMSLSNWFRSVF